jgi:hypothetical protein
MLHFHNLHHVKIDWGAEAVRGVGDGVETCFSFGFSSLCIPFGWFPRGCSSSGVRIGRGWGRRGGGRRRSDSQNRINHIRSQFLRECLMELRAERSIRYRNQRLPIRFRLSLVRFQELSGRGGGQLYSMEGRGSVIFDYTGTLVELIEVELIGVEFDRR